MFWNFMLKISTTRVGFTSLGHTGRTPSPDIHFNSLLLSYPIYNKSRHDYVSVLYMLHYGEHFTSKMHHHPQCGYF